jgi:hypothetical protein
VKPRTDAQCANVIACSQGITNFLRLGFHSAASGRARGVLVEVIDVIEVRKCNGARGDSREKAECCCLPLSRPVLRHCGWWSRGRPLAGQLNDMPRQGRHAPGDRLLGGNHRSDTAVGLHRGRSRQTCDVRFCPKYVCFTPKSGHVRCTSPCPLSARSGHLLRIKNPGFVCRGIWHLKCRGDDSLNTHQEDRGPSYGDNWAHLKITLRA